ncbi:MAG: DMT family transporter [Actinomycetia bacterium]|nr:DMT family transporter [Actinomycetes bacterium]
MKKNGFRIEYLLMIIVSFFWAIGHPLGKIVTRSLHPYQVAAVNLTIGFVAVVIFLLISGKIKKLSKLSPRDIMISLGLGVFGFFFYQILTFSALSKIPASINAVLISSNVIFIAILAAPILKERIGLSTKIGIGLAAIGVVLVTFNQGFSLNLSGTDMDLMAFLDPLLAALSFALYSVIGKKLLANNDPLIVAALALFSGAVLLNILTAFTVGYTQIFTASRTELGILIILGLTMIGIAYPLWFTCLKKLPASHVSIYIYLTPVFAVVLSLIILKESFSWLFWVGAVLILAGIIVTNQLKFKNAE